MLAFMDLVPAVSVDVCTEIVPTGVAPATDVTGKWLLPSVDPHVPAEMCCSDELPPTDPTWEGSVRLQLLSFFFCQAVHIQRHHLALHDLYTSTVTRHQFTCLLIRPLMHVM